MSMGESIHTHFACGIGGCTACHCHYCCLQMMQEMDELEAQVQDLAREVMQAPAPEPGAEYCGRCQAWVGVAHRCLPCTDG